MATRKKICKICQQFKALSEFKKDGRTRDGYTKTCTSCLDASRKPLKAPLSAFENLVEGLDYLPHGSLRDLVCYEPTDDQKEATFGLLLAMAEDRFADFWELLGLVTQDAREMSLVLMELLYAVYGLHDLQNDDRYKNFLRREVIDQFI